MALGDLVSNLKPGWAVKDQRGRPENSIVVIAETEDGHIMQDGKKPMTLSDGNGGAGAESADNFLYWDKAPQPASDGGQFANPGGSESDQFLICKSCLKEMKRYLTSEEEEHSSITTESSEKRLGKVEKKRLQRRKEVDQCPSICTWCKKCFVSRFALAAHSRFCRWKQRGIPVGSRKEKPVAPGRNFDLNRLPSEVFLPQGAFDAFLDRNLS